MSSAMAIKLRTARIDLEQRARDRQQSDAVGDRLLHMLSMASTAQPIMLRAPVATEWTDRQNNASRGLFRDARRRLRRASLDKDGARPSEAGDHRPMPLFDTAMQASYVTRYAAAVSQAFPAPRLHHARGMLRSPL
jgi:hypothetical protein